MYPSAFQAIRFAGYDTKPILQGWMSLDHARGCILASDAVADLVAGRQGVSNGKA